MSCNALQIPSPPTALSACAVPIGGSNSSILDTCCNGHINAIATYGAPGSTSNARADDGCFQFCVTDSPDLVEGCLVNTLGEYSKGEPIFQCFNTAAAVKKDEGSGYGSSGVRVKAGGMGWTVGIMLGLVVIGAAL